MPELLHHLLDAAAERWPDRPAVVHGDRQLAYAELCTRSRQLARLLRDEMGVRRGDRVGVCLDKSVEAVVAIHGALRAGAAYVPLDDRAPPARLAGMARDCDLRCLLTGRETAALWGRLAGGEGPVRDLVVTNATSDRCPPPPAGVRLLGAEAIDAQPARPAGAALVGADLACVLYTSGSTGRPKGVLLTHRNALAFVEWAAAAFELVPGDRLSSHAPLHFDLSIFDLFAAGRAGAATVLVDPRRAMLPVEVARLIDRRRISVWYSVPSILALLAQRGSLARGDLPSLRTVLFAGEVFPSRHLARLMGLLPHASFANLYGPTETNVCTYHRVAAPPAGADPIPIGRPVTGVEVHVVRSDGGLAAPGEIGELHVGGATVMRGYWGDPGRTAGSLAPDPWATGPGGRLYRTGDLVYRDAAGDCWFVGRSDDQVKSRGHRIALGEVEAALAAHPLVLECAVVAIPDELVTSRLWAWVVSGAEPDGAELRRFCAERLPRHMLPERFLRRPALPRTPTGKVDRRALTEEAMASPLT